MYPIKKVQFYILIIAIIFFVACQKEKKDIPPNIIYILMDDLGYGDINAFNSNSKIKTPRIDQIAKEGIIFTDAHTSSSVCTPTRYGILTGRYNWRSRLKKGVLNGASTALISKDRTTVASFLKHNGYNTGFIGKWHLGWNWSISNKIINEDTNSDRQGIINKIDFSKNITHSPNDLGFDYAYGHSGSLDMAPYVYVENERATAQINRFTSAPKPYSWWRNGPTASDFVHEEVTPHFFDKAFKFIRESVKKENPFFLYLPLPSPHTPILPTKEWKGKSGLNEYGDFVMQLDYHVGKLDDLVKNLGISENTMIIFTSDNGCSPEANFKLLKEKEHYPSGPYRGHKADIFEGGHRVPFIIKWPKKINAGIVSDKTVCTTDFLATCAAILNKKLSDQEGVDSFSMLPLFSDQTKQIFKRQFTIHHSINGSFAIRKGKYKFIFCHDSGGWSSPKPWTNEGKNLPKFQLYNLKNDPSESINLYGKFPKIENELISSFKSIVINGRSTSGEKQENFSNFQSNEKWDPLTVFD